MEQRTFLKELTLVSLFTLLVNGIYAFFSSNIMSFTYFGMAMVGVSLVCSVIMYMIGKRLLQSKQTSGFTAFSLYYGFIKMFVFLALFAVCRYTYGVTVLAYVLPFLISYIIFMIYETYVLMILSGIRPKIKK